MLNIEQSHPVLRLFDRPGKRFGQRLSSDAATGLADGHQACLSPIQSAVVLQLTHQSAVHQDDEVHVSCLTHPVPELTLAHAQMLLPVPMKGLGPAPASLVDFQYPVGFPMCPVCDQDLAWFFCFRVRPQDQEAYRVIDIRQTYRLREIPLGVAGYRELGAQRRRECLDPSAQHKLLTADHNYAIGFQVADICAFVAVDVVHNRRIGKVAVEGELAWDTLNNHPIDQLFGQVGVVLERVLVVTLLALAEAPKVERIVFATWIDVVDEQVIVGDQMAFVGMIPEIADILNQFALVINQGIVNRDHTIVTIAGGRVVLQPFETVRIDASHIPLGFREPAIEAGLVRSIGKLAGDTADSFVLSHNQTGQILGEMDAGGLIWKEVSKL